MARPRPGLLAAARPAGAQTEGDLRGVAAARGQVQAPLPPPRQGSTGKQPLLAFSHPFLSLNCIRAAWSGLATYRPLVCFVRVRVACAAGHGELAAAEAGGGAAVGRRLGSRTCESLARSDTVPPSCGGAFARMRAVEPKRDAANAAG